MTAIPYDGNLELIREAPLADRQREVSRWAIKAPFCAVRVWLDQGPFTHAMWNKCGLESQVLEGAVLGWQEQVRTQLESAQSECSRERVAICYLSQILACQYLHLQDGRALRFVLPPKKEALESTIRSLLLAVASRCDDLGCFRETGGAIALAACNAVGLSHREIPARILLYWVADQRDHRRELFESAIKASLTRSFGELDRLAIGLVLRQERAIEVLEANSDSDSGDSPNGVGDVGSFQSLADNLKSALDPEFSAQKWEGAALALIPELLRWIACHNQISPARVDADEIRVDHGTKDFLAAEDPWIRNVGILASGSRGAAFQAARAFIARRTTGGPVSAGQRADCITLVCSADHQLWAETIRKELFEGQFEGHRAHELQEKVAALATAMSLITSVGSVVKDLDPDGRRPDCTAWADTLVGAYTEGMPRWIAAATEKRPHLQVGWHFALHNLVVTPQLGLWRRTLADELGESDSVDAIVSGLKDEYWKLRRRLVAIEAPFEWVTQFIRTAMEAQRAALDASDGGVMPSESEVLDSVLERLGVDRPSRDAMSSAIGEAQVTNLARIVRGSAQAPTRCATLKHTILATRGSGADPLTHSDYARLVTGLCWVMARARMYPDAMKSAKGDFYKRHFPDVIRPALIGLHCEPGTAGVRAEVESAVRELIRTRMGNAAYRFIRFGGGGGGGEEEAAIASLDGTVFRKLEQAYYKLPQVPEFRQPNSKIVRDHWKGMVIAGALCIVGVYTLSVLRKAWE